MGTLHAGWPAGELVKPAVAMGQGLRTALARVLAQAADADWATVEVRDACYGTAYGNARFGGFLVTADSSAMQNDVPLLQAAGTRLRAALVVAAARHWGVAAEGLSTDVGRVRAGDGRTLAYAELARDMDLRDAEAAPLLPPPQVRWVGVDTPRSTRRTRPPAARATAST